MSCLFCKIAAGEIPSTIVFEDELCLAFRDIAPQAPEHVLVIPKQHVEGVDVITPENSDMIKHIFEVIPPLAEKLGLAGGYRVISNVGANGGQTVRHLHFHVIGGRTLKWEN